MSILRKWLVFAVGPMSAAAMRFHPQRITPTSIQTIMSENRVLPHLPPVSTSIAAPASPSLLSPRTSLVYPRSEDEAYTTRVTFLSDLDPNFNPPSGCSQLYAVTSPGSSYAESYIFGASSVCESAVLDPNCFPTGFPVPTNPDDKFGVYSSFTTRCPSSWEPGCALTVSSDGTGFGYEDLKYFMGSAQVLGVCCPSGWSCTIAASSTGEGDTPTAIRPYCTLAYPSTFMVNFCTETVYGEGTFLTSGEVTLDDSSTSSIGSAPAMGFLYDLSLDPDAYIPPTTTDSVPQTISSSPASPPGSSSSLTAVYAPPALPVSTTESATANHKSVNLPAVLGGTLGSLAGVLFASVIVFFIWRKKKKDMVERIEAELKQRQLGDESSSEPKELDGDRVINDRINGRTFRPENHPLMELASIPVGTLRTEDPEQSNILEENSGPAELDGGLRPFLYANREISELPAGEGHPMEVSGRSGVERRYLSRDTDTTTRFIHHNY